MSGFVEASGDVKFGVIGEAGEAGGGLSGSGGREKPGGGAVNFKAVTDILFFLRVVEVGEDGAAITINESEVFTAFFEGEVGVKRFSRIDEIFSRGKDDEEAVGGNRGARGEGPLSEIVGLVGEVVSFQGEIEGIAVLNFDPIGAVTKLIIQSGGIGSHELGEGGRDDGFVDSYRDGF